MTDRNPKQRLLKFAGKLTCSILFGLILLEGGLRLTGSCPPAPAPEADLSDMRIEDLVDRAARERWIHPPSTTTWIEVPGDAPDIPVTRNWCSCREDEETPLEKPAGTYRILVQGDSHTDGTVANPDSFANLLERKLGEGFDVMNCGQAISSPYQQLWIYRQLYRRFDPDYLIVAFYAGNDLVDLMVQYDRIHLEKRGSQFVHAGPTWRPDLAREQSEIKTWFYAHFAIIRAAAKLRWLSTDHLRQRPASYFQPLERARDQFPAPTWQGLNQAYYFKHYPEDWSRAADMLRFVLSEFKREAPRDGLMVVVIPTFRQMRPEVAAEAADLLRLTAEDQECDTRVCDLAVQLCQDLEIDVLDLRPAMLQHQGDLFWDFDHHINGAAHRLIAELLSDRLSVGQYRKP